jgi:hypothetical protein
VQGEINQEMVYRLTPEIVRLLHQSREPITIYIDSPGGSPYSMEELLRLLGMSNQDNNESCHLITVATALAASAAADLLSSGRYALAYPGSMIWFHGLRKQEEKPLTAEVSSSLAQQLRIRNSYYAMQLAKRIALRFMFRFVLCKGEFKQIREENSGKSLSELDCFTTMLSEKLSTTALEVLKKAQARHKRYDDLVSHVTAKTKNFNAKSVVKIEAELIKAITDFECKTHKRDAEWSFLEQGIYDLTDDFLLLHEYVVNAHSDDFQSWCNAWYQYILSKPEVDEIHQLPEADRAEKIAEVAYPKLRPIWSFFIALCHALQQGENSLTATDAYWLGLIDEVIGAKDLKAVRMISEFQPDSQEQIESHTP